MIHDTDARVALRLPITLCLDMALDERTLSCFTIDLSPSGVFVETVEEIPVGAQVGLDFQVEVHDRCADVSARGTVVRRTTAEEARERRMIAGIGVHFDDVTDGSHELTAFLADRLERLRPGAGARPGIERRRDPRVEVRLPVRWGERLPPARVGFLRNLSVSGGFVLEASQPVTQDTRIFMTMELPDQGRPKTVTAKANVVRMVEEGADAPVGMGVEFERRPLESELLQVFVRRRLEWVRAMANRAAGGLEHR